MKKTRLVIGIPAYNEKNNIGYILKDIVSQKLKNGVIKQIVVFSDQSTDGTNEIVTTFKQVKLIKNTTRLGKSGSVKKLFQLTKDNADITIIIDADTRLASEETIENLILPFTQNEKVLVVSGRVIPHNPRNFVEKIGYFNIMLFDQIINNSKKNTDYYLCSDQLVAIRNKYLQIADLTKEYMHDEFYFLLAMKKKLKFISAEDAISFYRLPANFSDYLNQMARFLASPSMSESNFGKKFMEKYQTLTLMDKLKGLAKLFTREPRISVAYFGLQAWAKLLWLFSPRKKSAVWLPIISTK